MEPFSKLSRYRIIQKKNILNTNKLHNDLQTFTEEKVNCQLVYRTELGKVVTTQGIVRGIFKKTATTRVAILENGLPIPTQNLLHIQRMEG